MKPELRKTGIGLVGDMPWGTHFCHFYETKQDLLDTLVPFFKTGLENKEFCLWVVSNSELITVGEATGALERAVPDLGRHLSNGNIEILNGLDWYFHEDELKLERVTRAWDAKLERALSLGYDGMRVSGDTLWLREKDWKEFSAYEKQVNDSISDRHMTVLCTYPLTKSKAAAILDVVETHQFAIARRRGNWKVLHAPELMEAKAEIQRLNEAVQRVGERTPEPPLTLRYVVAVLAVAVALTIALYLDSRLTPASGMLFICGLMFSAWYGGMKPALLAMALSLLVYKYCFVTPIHSLSVGAKEIPRLLIFASASAFVVLLGAAQRNAAESLRRARDVLDGTVQELNRTNETLRAKSAERKRAEEARLQSEDRFRQIAENIREVFWMTTADLTTTLYISPAYEAVWGQSRERLYQNPRSFFEAIHPEDRPRVVAIMETDREQGFEAEYRVVRPDGSIRWIWDRGFPIKDESGRVYRLAGIAEDITDRKQAEESLRSTGEQLRALSARLHTAREEEGIRIAREVHDELGAALASLRWGMEGIDKIVAESGDQSQAPAIRKRIAGLFGLTDTAIRIVRRIASELRPGVLDLELVAAIQWQGRQFQDRTGIVVECACPEEVDLSQEQGTAVFRIFQEALTNILRHAQATRVDVRMTEEAGVLVLTIRDNGRGIREDEKSGPLAIGLLGMRERAHLIGGQLDITGMEGKGTTVTVRLTIDRPEHPFET
jgi:PAS domain S-box-containing protein